MDREIQRFFKEQGITIGTTTVYRNLDFLTESKEILKLESAGSIRRFDGDTRPHQHVRCRVCGKIGDVIPPVPTPSVEGVSVEGFTITEARVEYEGICEECARKAS